MTQYRCMCGRLFDTPVLAPFEGMQVKVSPCCSSLHFEEAEDYEPELTHWMVTAENLEGPGKVMWKVDADTALGAVREAYVEAARDSLVQPITFDEPPDRGPYPEA